MKNNYLKPAIQIVFLFLLFLGFLDHAYGQQHIAWQKSIGTTFDDYALKIFTDDGGNLVIIGNERHLDFTGAHRLYLVTSKIDLAGNVIWKTYHDLLYDTFSFPVDYYLGNTFYTEENGKKMISVVISMSGRNLLYTLTDDTGEFYTYKDISSGIFTIDRNNIEAYANILCSSNPSCYGPDSLIVQKFNPNPVIGQNPITWTFGLKQNIRTAPIQGHYDFNNQDITSDEEGNVYLLTQIDRWDFQFCTDCNDAFIDAYDEIFKFDTAGQLVNHVKLITAKAVVSNMRFISFADGKMVIKIDDINASGTELLSSIFIVNEDLNVTRQFALDRQYNIITADKDLNLFACTNVYDTSDVNIKGLSDVLVARFNADGVFQWKSYFGGTNFDYPVGMTVTNDDGLAFFVNTQSSDFDIAENHGNQDMWLVKLEEGTTATTQPSVTSHTIYPNPASDVVYFSNPVSEMNVVAFDVQGKQMLHQKLEAGHGEFVVSDLPPGCYTLKITDHDGNSFQKLIKI